MNLKIGILAHYGGMRDAFSHLEKTESCSLIFKMGVLDLGIEPAIAMEKTDKVDAIISNVKTADIIRNYVTVPVVAVHLKNFNLVHAFYKAKERGKKLAFTELYKDRTMYDFKYVREIVGCDVEKYTFNELSQVPIVLKKIIEDKRDVVVTSAGCMIASAEKMGVQSVLVEFEENDLIEAIRTVRNLLAVKHFEKEKANWLGAIIDSSSDGIITLNKEGEVNLMNQKAQTMLDVTDASVCGQKIEKLAETHPFFSKAISLLDGIEIIKETNREIVVNRRDIFSSDLEYMGTVFNLSELKSIQKIELQARKKMIEKGFIAQNTFEDIKGSSLQMNLLKEKARKYARTFSNILIIGESGSGKEIFAQSIHNFSDYSAGPFLAINCATLPEPLLESELFGYEDGAFTGAKKGGKQGLFEMAHDGTLFLDEIGEMSVLLQSRLLRVLQEKVVRRIGGDKNLPINVRIICATHKDLFDGIGKGKFREDLFYRINVLSLKIPPLRERKGDIALIAEDIVRKVCDQSRKNIHLSEDQLKALEQYNWYGNVRELNNFIERLIALSDENNMMMYFNEMFEELMAKNRDENAKAVEDDPNHIVLPIGTMRQMENEIIRSLYNKFDRDKKTVERTLDLSSTTLWRRYKELSEESRPAAAGRQNRGIVDSGR